MLGLQNLKLLVVEDDPVVARSVERVLERHGHTVCVTHSRADALQHEAERFDAAILDIDLPDGNGVQLAELLLAAHTAVVVVFFSGTSAAESLVMAARLGRVVSKSAGFGALERAVVESTAQAAQKAVGAEETPRVGLSTRDTGARLRVPSGTRPKVPKR